MVTKTRITGLMIAVMVLSPSFVYANNGGNYTGGRDSSQKAGEWSHGGGDHFMARVLNLNEGQQKQLKAIKQKKREVMKSTFERIRSKIEAINQEIVKAAPDMNKINDLQNQLKTIQSQMSDNHLNTLLEIKKIMTPEQFAGFMALTQERKLMGQECHKFGRKCALRKDREEHKHWGDRGDEDR